MSNIIHLPVYPHVRQYLGKHYGSCLYLHERHYACSLLKLLLKNQNHKFEKSAKESQLGAVYPFVLGKGVKEEYGQYLSRHDIISFSKTIENLILKELFKWVNHPFCPEDKIDFAIKEFINFYDFSEDDFPFSQLKRWFFRERIRDHARKNHQSDLPRELRPLFFIDHNQYQPTLF